MLTCSMDPGALLSQAGSQKLKSSMRGTGSDSGLTWDPLYHSNSLTDGPVKKHVVRPSLSGLQDILT